MATLRNHQGAQEAPRAGINEFNFRMTIIKTEYIFPRCLHRDRLHCTLKQTAMVFKQHTDIQKEVFTKPLTNSYFSQNTVYVAKKVAAHVSFTYLELVRS